MNIKPIHLISGDVPLLTQETRETLIQNARVQGFSEKITWEVGVDFSLTQLQQHLQCRDLFSLKKIIDIRNDAAKWDKETQSFLENYFDKSNLDRCIIITTNKLTATQQKAAWFLQIKKHGVHTALWPVTGDALIQWIIKRASTLQLTVPLDIARFLAQYTEGNLLSTHQALIKLQLLFPAQTITQEKLGAVLIDQAQFHVFDLGGAIQKNDTKKIIRIIKKLRDAEEEPAFLLWYVSRYIRESLPLNTKTKKALAMAAKIDRIIKGVESGDVWQGMTSLCFTLCGAV